MYFSFSDTVYKIWNSCILEREHQHADHKIYSQNVPLSKRPVVETSQSHNVPSQNVPPWSKRPESNRPHVKITT